MPKTMPAPISKVKVVALDTEKADRKGRAESADARASTDARHAPLPAPKSLSAPKTTIIVREIGKSAPKGKADSDNAAWTVAGKQKSLSPAAKSKIGETVGRKQDGNAKADATRSGANARPMPTSGSKTKIVETEGRKETGKHDRKGSAEPARESTKAGATKAGATTAAKHTASPKAKVSETDGKKQSGKGKAEPAKAGDDGKSAARPARQAASARRSSGALN